MQRPSYGLLIASLALVLVASSALAATAAEEFDWRRFEGEQIRLHGSNHPWMNAILPHLPEFVELTGISVSYDLFSEDQMRQRLTVALQAQSPEIDVFMSLKTREGLLYRNAGWYADLNEFINDPSMVAPGYDFEDFSPASLEGELINGQLTGIPLNVEGPVFYYRTDILDQYGLKVPGTLDELVETVQILDEKLPDNVAPFVSRGLKGALAYTFSPFFHNVGAEWVDKNGNSAMSSEAGVRALELYAGLLRDYGPPGVINYTFYQITNLLGQRGAALAFASSNEFNNIIEHYEGDEHLLGVKNLPLGPGGSHPTVIGWGVSVSAFSENKGPAWYFVQWATSPEMQARLSLQGLAPPRVSIWESEEFQQYLGTSETRRQWAETLVEMMEIGTSAIAPPVEDQPRVRDIIGDAVQQVILGTMTAEQAAQMADQRIQPLL